MKLIAVKFGERIKNTKRRMTQLTKVQFREKMKRRHNRLKHQPGTKRTPPCDKKGG